MRKKLILLVLALAAVAATSAITPASAANNCPPPKIQVHCDGFTICCYRFEPCICP